MSRKSRSAPAEAEDESPEGLPAAARRRSLQPLAALGPYLVRHPLMLAVAGIALVVSALVMLAVPMAVRGMIDVGFTASDGVFIDRTFATLVGLGLILSIASSSRVYCVNWLGERVVADLRADVFQHLVILGPAFFERTHSAELMSRLTADTTQLKSAAGSTISQALRNTIMLAGAFVMMLVTSIWLSALVLVAIPAIVLPLVWLGGKVRRLSRAAQDSLAEASAYAAENLAAVRTMQAFNHEPAVIQRFTGAVDRAFEVARQRLRARAGLMALTMALIVLSIVGVLWLGAAAVVRGEMSGGTLSQFILYALFAAGALAELSEVWGEVNQAAGAAERLVELLEVIPEIRSPANPLPMPEPPRGAITFGAVDFTYPSRKDQSALHGITLTVAPGETVALVGPSGAGKSTIFNLLLRFYDPVAGTISVDGVGVDQVRLEDLRARMAVVPQEVALFDDTVMENIRYGTPGASDHDCRRAAQAAQAAAFIQDLPEGYRTRLGERGVMLSGGQRQRLAIARAILKNAPILLLDEATSALDAENEMLVQQALEGVMAGRTTLVIAHRLATVQKADRIVVLDQGRIVEEGTHATLLRTGGLYSRLADLQFTAEAAQ